MRHYFIYYRIAPEQISRIESALQRMQLEIEAQSGIMGRLLKKSDDPNLWMEVYENVPEDLAFEEILSRAAAQSGLANLLTVGEKRHVECFQD